jgi:hypothetical protein
VTVKYIRDVTGRFGVRPYYEAAYIDAECERLMTEFMRERYGGLTLPIPTDALTKLIERDASDLDLYADLSDEEAFIDGVTDFFLDPDLKPAVRIAKGLSEEGRRETRLRTTLTHEYFHVKFHGPLYEREARSPKLFPEMERKIPVKCHRESIATAAATDWLEWQAGYACGAFLMLASHVRQLIADYVAKRGLLFCPRDNSVHAAELRSQMVDRFFVSPDAARVRLLKLGYVTNHDEDMPLPI